MMPMQPCSIAAHDAGHDAHDAHAAPNAHYAHAAHFSIADHANTQMKYLVYGKISIRNIDGCVYIVGVKGATWPNLIDGFINVPTINHKLNCSVYCKTIRRMDNIGTERQRAARWLVINYLSIKICRFQSITKSKDFNRLQRCEVLSECVNDC